MSDDENQLSYRRVLLWVAVAIAALITTSALTFAAYDWLGPQSQAGVGFSATLTALAVGVGGFAVTFWQLARTRKAAVEARMAVARLKKGLSSFDIIAEIRTARGLASETARHVSGSQWPTALATGNLLAESLQKVLSVPNGLSPGDGERVKDHLGSALDACSSIEYASQPGNSISQAQLTGMIREMNGFLIDLEGRLKDQIGAE